ncbi:methyltransferase-like protein 9 isoform X2 [Sitophilus oryzae]|uniref:Methyltransferase-like protein 9 isoform X2 n=1 Tax=Sitophilus oryzae TaxID=7048 RepID=A0A6J2YV76_SITOR|nr:methyltransferase-like protein 9 isoform X2 [Sitophilus oryzae]
MPLLRWTFPKLKLEWYNCNLSDLPVDLAQSFVQLGPDQDTVHFLEESEKKSDWIFTQLWHALVKFVLGLFMTQTSINGWLQCGSMFVISKSQLIKLLKVDENVRYDSLLDLGAGDGKVTAHLAPLFDKIYVTEVSETMKKLLGKQGYQVLDVEDWCQDRKFNVISCLNLLDRCNAPLSILENIRNSLAPDGYVLLALVLPFSAYIETGSSDHKPVEALPVKGNTFESQVESLVENVLRAKFELISWSRVPYLCEGDLRQSYYWLDDVILVLKATK